MSHIHFGILLHHNAALPGVHRLWVQFRLQDYDSNDSHHNNSNNDGHTSSNNRTTDRLLSYSCQSFLYAGIGPSLLASTMSKLTFSASVWFWKGAAKSVPQGSVLTACGYFQYTIQMRISEAGKHQDQTLHGFAGSGVHEQHPPTRLPDSLECSQGSQRSTKEPKRTTQLHTVRWATGRNAAGLTVAQATGKCFDTADRMWEFRADE